MAERIDPGRSAQPPVLVVGLGNPILGDDGVGWRIVEQVERQWHQLAPIDASLPVVEFEYLALGGLSLMERLVGYRRVVLVDSITSRARPVGAILCAALADLPPGQGSHLTSAHDTSLQTAIEIGRSLNASLPEQISLVGVEIVPDYEFKDQLSPAVAKAIPEAAALVVELLNQQADDVRKAF